MTQTKRQDGAVEITMQEWEDYLRLQEAAKRAGWTLFDMLRMLGTMQTREEG